LLNRNEERLRRGLRQLAEEPVEPDIYNRLVSSLWGVKKKESRVKSFALKSALAGGLLAAVVAALILVPATYSVNVGSLATVAFDARSELKPMDVVAALSIPNTQKMMTVEQEFATITIAARGAKASQLRQAIDESLKPIAARLEGLRVSVEPISETRGGNALAAVTGGRIEIGVDGLTDAEIEDRIAAALSAHGMSVRRVQVSTTSPKPGQIKRRVEIEAEGDSLSGSPDIHLNDESAAKGRFERVIVREEKWAVGENGRKESK